MRYFTKEIVMRISPFALLFSCFALGASAQTPIDIQPVKQVRPNGVLTTCDYKPAGAEATFFGRLGDGEKTNGTVLGDPYSIHGKTGTYVSWFGIVRGISSEGQPGEVTLLAQHHYFDGTTDCHIMLVAKSGDGDFVARLKIDPSKIPSLSLVRIYGKVTGESDGVPEVAVEYARVWPWMTFTFNDLADADHSNPRWQRASQWRLSDLVYEPYPNENYYLRVLGDPSKFGVNLRAQ
jgi:hypothetical protein